VWDAFYQKSAATFKGPAHSDRLPCPDRKVGVALAGVCVYDLAIELFGEPDSESRFT
jgi:hypothetical protein